MAAQSLCSQSKSVDRFVQQGHLAGAKSACLSSSSRDRFFLMFLLSGPGCRTRAARLNRSIRLTIVNRSNIMEQMINLLELVGAITMIDKIKQVFDADFESWDITLPEDDLRERRKGSISKAGWSINYRFGSAGGIEYIEYFATHRMTNDTLNRIYEDGNRELVGYCQEFYAANDPEAERDYYAHNQKFYAEVKSSGLLAS